MESALRQAVEIIHHSPTQIVLYVAGGASHAPAWLLSVPGASGTILETRVPYDRSAFIDIVGKDAAASLASFASLSAARSLAAAAYRRAVKLAPPGTRVCGIAAACGLVTVTPKKGDHRACVATHSSDRVTEYELNLKKGHRGRWDEEVVSSRLVLQALLDDCGGTRNGIHTTNASQNKHDLDALVLSQESSMSLVRDLLVVGDRITGPSVSELPDCVDALLDGHIDFAEYSHQSWNRSATCASLIFPGSFNPLHKGHRALLAVAKALYPDETPAYEISVTNPDKPSLEKSVIYERIAQFDGGDIVLITRAPLFTTKARILPHSRFVIGVDTAIRIVAPKYYGGQAGMISSLADLKARGCRFLVAGRLEQRKDGPRSGKFQTLSDVNIPLGFEDIFEEIPGSSFRLDISSSEIRERNKLS